MSTWCSDIATMSTISKKLEACWIGKSIGGTLGVPLEGSVGPHGLKFYDPIPSSVAPNDDLDLQVVWMHFLLKNGVKKIVPGGLSEAWRRHVRFQWDEYGCCLRNLDYGLKGSEIGAFDNWFSECMGAAIRSEMWACVAPGEPARAAGFAYCDAVADHAGDGVWAIVFLSALQSAAFVENIPNRLLDTGLSFLPRSSRVFQAVQDTRLWWNSVSDSSEGWLIVRNQIITKYGTGNFTDVAANLAFLVLGWLAGRGDFGQSLCVAVNCGLDTDCTAASLGALLGILDPEGIPAEWSTPIGDKVVLSPGILDVEVPSSTSVLTDWTLSLKSQLALDSPEVGKVVPRQPATAGNSPIEIRMRMGWTGNADVLDLDSIDSVMSRRLLSQSQEVSLPGHWSRWSCRDDQRPVLLAQREVEIERGQEVRVLGFGGERCAAWLDGVRLEVAPHGPCCENSRAPGFHRGGPGVFGTGEIEEGTHTLLVGCLAPSGGSFDLVVGLGDARTCLWNPFGLANLKEELNADSQKKLTSMST